MTSHILYAIFISLSSNTIGKTNTQFINKRDVLWQNRGLFWDSVHQKPYKSVEMIRTSFHKNFLADPCCYCWSSSRLF